jgi:hypothetical protein
MSATAAKKILLVEGNTEKRLIPELMKQRGVTWEPEPKKYAVEIASAGGLVTQPGLISARLKESNLSAFGVLFDADGMTENAGQNRWSALRIQCETIGINLPSEPQPEGFICELPNGIRFGAWMMPDNKPPGMLETFLLRLVRSDGADDPLFSHTQDAVKVAQEKGAPFKSVHRDKALIHTWLAWQDQPGAQLHEAVKFRFLDSASSKADTFVKWFRNLFGV